MGSNVHSQVNTGCNTSIVASRVHEHPQVYTGCSRSAQVLGAMTADMCRVMLWVAIPCLVTMGHTLGSPHEHMQAMHTARSTLASIVAPGAHDTCTSMHTVVQDVVGVLK